jgi:tyrosinase
LTLTVRRRHTAGLESYVTGVVRLREERIYHKYVWWHNHYGMIHDHSPGSGRRGVAHDGPSFLPWHREFIWRFENDLKAVLEDETSGLPYWNWARDKTAGELAVSSLWSALGANAGQVWIRGRQWTRMYYLPGFDIAYDSDSPVRRDFDGYTGEGGGNVGDIPGQAAVRELLRSVAPYDAAPWNERLVANVSFRFYVENSFHNNIHRLVGGDNGDMTLIAISPNDPVFFLHHSMVDRLWAKWQDVERWRGTALEDQYRPTMAEAEGIQFGHRIDEPMLPWSDEAEMERWGLPREDVTPRMVLDHRGDRLHYRYDDQDRFGRFGWLEDAVLSGVGRIRS